MLIHYYFQKEIGSKKMNVEMKTNIFKKNVVQTRSEEKDSNLSEFQNKLTRSSISEVVPPQTSARHVTSAPEKDNEVKGSKKMNYNVVDDLKKLQITFPFLEIPQKKNIVVFKRKEMEAMENFIDVTVERSNFLSFIGSWMMSFVGSFSKLMLEQEIQRWLLIKSRTWPMKQHSQSWLGVIK
jgi:hypothetical protein